MNFEASLDRETVEMLFPLYSSTLGRNKGFKYIKGGKELSTCNDYQESRWVLWDETLLLQEEQ